MTEAAEEHFILRVKPQALANKLRSWLREQQGLEGRAELLFEENNRRGRLVVEGVTYPVSLEDLPTRVESFKTLDDANLVKITDVGQVLLVHEPGTELPAPPSRDQERQQHPAAIAAVEARDGVTPPMRKARSRQFRPRFTIQRDSVFKFEECLLEILQGRAPEGWSFRDVEEEYRVDPITGEGRWVQLGGGRRFGRKPAHLTGEDSGATPPPPGGKGPGRRKKKRDSDEDDADFEEELTDSD